MLLRANGIKTLNLTFYQTIYAAVAAAKRATCGNGNRFTVPFFSCRFGWCLMSTNHEAGNDGESDGVLVSTQSWKSLMSSN